MPEPLDVTIERAGGACPPWAKPAVPERVWREAVGVRIADRARPVELDRGVLVVRAATNVWATELSLLGEQIAARLRERGFHVTSLRLRVGPVERKGGASQKRRTRVPRAAPLPEGLERVLAGVVDDSLREVISDAARSNLAWQDHVSAGLRASRDPRSAETESDRPDRASGAEPGASRRTPSAWPRRPS
jgi:hypothetical protein